ncbi:MAG: photosynthetic complex putative assembly protein PuhB [Congregibacter sp.]
MSVGEYEFEPVRGLPEYLPEGETLIWQGSPDARTMGRRVFRVRVVAVYFAALIAVHLGFQLSQGRSVGETLLGSSWMLALGVAAVAILAGMAAAYAKTTVYTLTDKRIVLRSGVAMPMMVNIPLNTVTAADMRAFGDGSGDIIFSVERRKRLSHILLWPNVRPWKFTPVQPAFRSVQNIEAVAAALASVVKTDPNATEVPHADVAMANGDMLGAS